MMRAKRLLVNMLVYEKKIEVTYKIDEDFQGRVSFGFPFPISASPTVISAVGLWESIFLGQLCLAEEIELQFPIVEGMVEDLQPVVESIYDIRCCRDRISLVNLPIIKARHSPFAAVPVDDQPNKRACVLWSGGKDSTLSIVLLSKNGYEPIPLHFNANVDTVELERKAVIELAEQMKIEVQFVNIDFPDFVPIATRYSDAIARPPFDNSIPHSRELLLLGPAFIISKQLHASNICFGHEKSMWSAQVIYEGKPIWRWDTASEAMVTILNNFITKYIDRSIRVFSPVAPLSDFRSFEMLLREYPNLLQKITSCFFGHWCGKCGKCFRYYLYQRVLGEYCISFQQDPIKERNIHLEKYIYLWQDRERNFWADVQYALYKLVDGSSIESEPMLKYYKDVVYPLISDEMPQIRGQISDIHPNNLIPPDWNYEYGESSSDE